VVEDDLVELPLEDDLPPPPMKK
jgi:hypothetical protein